MLYYGIFISNFLSFLMNHVMISLSKHEGITPRNSRSSGYDVESLLAPETTVISQTTTTGSSSKRTAKVQPFEVIRENDLMESSNPRPENEFPKGLPNPPLFPSLGYPPYPSPLALANLHWYSLLSSAQAHAQAGFANWPFLTSPVFAQSATTPKVQPTASDPSLTNGASRAQTNVKQQNEDTSHSSNSATESLLAASECHLAVLKDDDGDTPLHIAIVHENERLIQKLVGLISFSKLTVNTPNKLCQTALHLAVLTRQPQVVQQLMNAAADANSQDRNGQTAIHLSAAKGYINCLNEILNAKSKKPKIDLEIKNFDGLTALHLAVQKKCKSIVEMLIQHGANINAKDGKSGHTPLHHAIDQECCEILQLLVAKGAKINKPNYSGVTPVQTANCCRNEAISKILLSQEAAITPVTATTKTRQTVSNVSPISTMNAINKVKSKESDIKSETFLKRRIESSPSTSKRARSDAAK